MWIIFFIHLLLYLASHMWLLGQILPLLIGDFIDYDDEHWLLHLLLMEIVDHLFSPKTSKAHAIYTVTLTAQNFVGKIFIPTMHFMVHMPRLVIK